MLLSSMSEYVTPGAGGGGMEGGVVEGGGTEGGRSPDTILPPGPLPCIVYKGQRSNDQSYQHI